MTFIRPVAIAIDPQPTRGGDIHWTTFQCPEGTVVRAIADGMIIKAATPSAAKDVLDAGLHIAQLIIRPGYDSWRLRYSFLKRIFVKLGQMVREDDPIGETGADQPLRIEMADIRKKSHPIPWRI